MTDSRVFSNLASKAEIRQGLLIRSQLPEQDLLKADSLWKVFKMGLDIFLKDEFQYHQCYDLNLAVEILLHQKSEKIIIEIVTLKYKDL